MNHIFLSFSNLLNELNSALFTFIMMPALLFVGIFFTFKTSFIQLRCIKWLFLAKTRCLLCSTNQHKNAISNFESFVISCGARVGIGNIVGISLAILSGGAGALVWMIIAAFFGAATAFSECTLAKIYARSSSGGVAHYIKYGLNSPLLAHIFIICLIASDAFGFNPLLAHTLNVELINKFHINAYLGAFIISLVALFIFIKGIRFLKIIVPLMLAGYLLLALLIVIFNSHNLINILTSCIKDAFSLKAGLGALLGSTVSIGIKQGLFSNEAGLGSAPNAASAADCEHPCIQGIVQMCAVGFDLLICCASALIALSMLPNSINDAQALMNAAFIHYFGAAGEWLFFIFVLAFALTSFYGNYYYSLRAFSLIGPIPKWFLPACFVACFIGSLYDALLAWNLASTLMCAMALINLYAITRLNKQVKFHIKDFYENYIK